MHEAMLPANSSKTEWYHELLNAYVPVTAYLIAVCLAYCVSMYPSVWCRGV